MKHTFLDKILFSNDNFKKFNSATKYPSIATYHNLGPKNSLVDSLVENKDFSNEEVFITEKIDGSNSRLILFTDSEGYIEDYLIGSREDILYAKGDRIINQNLGIVENMKKLADTITVINETDISGPFLNPYSVYCLYGETYGGKVNNAKQYSKYGNYRVRIFDLLTLTQDEIENLLDLNLMQIVFWRDNGNQPFLPIFSVKEFCSRFNLTTVPHLRTILGNEIPISLQDTWDWMQQFKTSNAVIDEGGLGNAEGIVIRNADRSLIRKLRFEDYQKSQRMGLIT